MLVRAVDKIFLFVYSLKMDNQNNNSNPTDPVTSTTNANDQPTAVPPVEETPVVPTDPNKDLQDLSKDLENLAKEAVQTEASQPAQSSVAEPVAPPAAPVATEPVASEPVVAPPVADPVSEPSVEKTVADEEIVVYTTNACPFCKSEKEFLTEQGLKFTEKDVEENTEVLKEMLSLSDNFAGVPVTVLNGPKGKKVVKGFTKEEFVNELIAVGLKQEEEKPEPTKPEVPIEPATAPAPTPVAAEPVSTSEAPPTTTEPPTTTAAEPTVPDLN